MTNPLPGPSRRTQDRAGKTDSPTPRFAQFGERWCGDLQSDRNRTGGRAASGHGADLVTINNQSFPAKLIGAALLVGMFGLKWLVDHGALPKQRLEEYYSSCVAGIFRTLRFGTGEAHGRAEMMEFSYLAEQQAITYNAGRYTIDLARIPGALAALAKQLLEMEATGDRARVEAWFAKYDRMPQELKTALAATSSIPVDINPVFAFADRVQ